MSFALFIVLALIAVASALVVITQRHPVNSVLALIVTFFCLAMLYVMLGAQFIAALQVIVYAGAIMVLFLFILMLLNLSQPQKWDVRGPLRTALGFAVAGGVLLIAVTMLRKPLGLSAALDPAMGSVGSVGDALFRRFLLPFEVVSVLLLIAIIGVVALVKREPDSGKEAGNEPN